MHRPKRLSVALITALFLLNLCTPTALAEDAPAPQASPPAGSTTPGWAAPAAAPATGAPGSGKPAGRPASDIAGTPYEGAVRRLGALGILKGYPDGSFKPAGTITRAEFAAVAVRAAGLAGAVAEGGATTGFSDLPAGHWAAGYVAAASSDGLLRGYPDGSFRPEAPVTYAEALAILVRILGYEPDVKGTWPTGYLNKAAQLGLTDGLQQFQASAPATRGDVSLIFDSALTVDRMVQVGYGTDTRYEVQDGSTLLSEYHDGVKLEHAHVTRTAQVSLGELAQAEAEVTDEDGAAYTFHLVEGLNPEPLLGHEVTAWVIDQDENGRLNDDDLVILLEDQTEKEETLYAWPLFGEPGVVRTEGGVTTAHRPRLFMDWKWDWYTVAEGAQVYYNFKNYGRADTDTDKDGIPDKLEDIFRDGRRGEISGRTVLDESGDIVFMHVANWNKPLVVTAVDAEAEEIRTFDQNENETTLDLEGDEYFIYRRQGPPPPGVKFSGAYNEKPASLAEIQPNDILYHFEPEEGVHYIFAYGATVAGTLADTESDESSLQEYKIFIDGNKYGVSIGATISKDGGETVKTGTESDLEDLVGEQVTVYLDRSGDARHIIASVQAGDLTYAMVTTPPWTSVTRERTYYVELVHGDNVEVTYQLTDGTAYTTYDEAGNKRLSGEYDPDEPTAVTIAGKSQSAFAWLQETVLAGDLFGIEVNADGTLDVFQEVNVGSRAYDQVSAIENIDSDNDRVKVGGKWYAVTAGSVIFDARPAGSYGPGQAYPVDTSGPFPVVTLQRGEAVDWDSIEDARWDKMKAFAMPDDDDAGVLGAMVIYSADPADAILSAVDAGVVVYRRQTVDGLKLVLNVEGQQVEYLAADAGIRGGYGWGGSNAGTQTANMAKIEQGDVVEFWLDSDGEIAEVREPEAVPANNASVVDALYGPGLADPGGTKIVENVKNSFWIIVSGGVDQKNRTVEVMPAYWWFKVTTAAGDDPNEGKWVLGEVKANGQAAWKDLATGKVYSHDITADRDAQGKAVYAGTTFFYISSDSDDSMIFDVDDDPFAASITDLKDGQILQFIDGDLTGETETDGLAEFVKIIER